MGKYEEALERARQGKPIDEVFPELKESEDERIRKWLIDYFKKVGKSWLHRDISPEQILAYLEKQKEQPTDAKLERVIKAARRVLNNWLDGTDCPDVSGDFAELEFAFREYDGEEQKEPITPEERMNHPLYLEGFDVGKSVGEALKGRKKCVADSSKTSVEWSEEVEKDIQEASDYLRDYANKCVYGGNSKLYVQSLADRIESLRPQPHWKPSEEQMNRLVSIIAALRKDYCDDMADFLASLYHNLEKLM